MSNQTPLYELGKALNFHDEAIRATRLIRDMREKAKGTNVVNDTSAFIDKALDALSDIRIIAEMKAVEKFRAALADCKLRGLVIKETEW